MTDLLNEVEYGRVLGSFTAVAEDFGETVAPDAIPLNGKITFNPTKSNVSYINSAGETANLYVAPVQATISNGRIIGKDGRDGVVLLASNSNNVSASVLWNARISLNPVVNGNEAPADQDFLIEVRRGEVVSLIDVIKATSLVHNIALFNDAIATAAEKFWERVEAGEFRGNQGPPGPAGGPGIGMPGPVGIPGRSGVDGAPGVGGNLIADGDLESPGFLVAGDYTESNDALNGAKSASITEATSRKILLEPEKSYIGSVYIKSPTATSVSVDLRVFGPEGDISRVITNAYNIPADTWRKVTFLLDSEVGDQSVEIIARTDGRRVLVDNYFLSDNSVVAGLQKDLSAAQAQLEAAMADLDVDLENVDAERERLAQSLNDLAVVLEDANVDLSAVEAEIADLNEDLATEAQKRFDADQAAQILMQQLDQNLSQAKQDLAANQVILDNLSGDLVTAAEELQTVNDSLNTLETVTLPALEQTLTDAAQAAQENLNELENQLLGSEGEVTKAKESINQLVDDLAAEAQARQDLATTMQTTFQERDDRLATAEDILAQAFPTGAVDVSRALRSSIVEYAVSSSETVPPSTGWTTDTPTRAPGMFIWFRTVVTYMDDTTSTTSAALLTGNTGATGPEGPAGADGADGTGVTILGSKTSESQLPATGNPGDAYLVSGYLYVWSDGTWTNVGLIRGPQGVQGPAGEDGKPTYTWVKYSNSATGAGMSDDPAGMAYIGLSHNNVSNVESTDPADYQWAKFQGSQGVSITSVTPYFRDAVRGSAAPATPTTSTPSGWSTSEPAWAEGRDLYRTEKITYSNGTFAYTTVTKIASYAGIDAAITAANGKNKITYTDLAVSSKPGPAPAPDNSRAIGDIHRNRNSTTGEIWAEYQWTGSAWKEVSYGDEILRSLDVGKVTGGTGAFQQFFADKLIANDATIDQLWTDQLVGKTAAFNKLSVSPSNLIPDPQGRDSDITSYRESVNRGWVMSTGGYWRKTTDVSGNNQLRLESSADTFYTNSEVTPGQRYSLQYEVYLDAGSAECRYAIRYTKIDGSIGYVGDSTEIGGDTNHYDAVSGPGYTTVTRYWDAPSDAVMASFDVQVNSVSGSTDIRVRNPIVLPTVGAVSIENGAISADKINAESVAGAVGSFIELETSQLIATDSIKTPEAVIDKLWAEQMAVKKVYSENIVVSSGNLITDRSKFGDTTPNTAGTGRLSVVSSATYGKHLYLTLPASAQTWTYGVWFNAPKQASSDFFIDVQPSTEYRFSFGASAGGTMGGSMPRVRIVLYCYDVDGTYISGRVGTSQSLTWNRSEWSVTTELPDNCVYVRPCVSYEKDATTGNYTGGIRVYDPTLIATVGAVQISDGAVNASKINAESVGAAVGEFVKLDVKNLVASSANINSLVAQKIAAGTAAFQTVNADKIIASTGTMDSATINQIWADGIAAKSLTTASITVGTQNAYEHPNLEEPSGWNSNRYSSSGGRNGGGSVLIESGTSQRGSYYSMNGTPPGVPISPGKYALGAWMKPSETYTGRGPTLYARLYKDDGSWMFAPEGGTNYYGDGTANVWQYEEWDLEVPDEGYTRLVIGFYINNPYTGAARFSNPSLRPKVGAVLIENGAVSANHIAADSIDTDHLRTNSVSAAKIISGAVTTDKMTANSINGDRITANTLNASKITANTITASKIASRTISAAEIKSRTITANEIVANTITSNEIKARTITAAEILAGTLTANELNISNISANTAIIDGLWANGISAKAISTSRLVASVDNLIENGGGEYGDLTSWQFFAMDTEPPAETGAKTGYRSASASFFTIGEKFPVQAGQRYVLDVWLHWSAANVNTAIQIIWQNASGTQLSGPYPIWPKTGPAGLTYYSAEEVAPAGAAMAYIRVVPSHSAGSPGTTTFYNLRLRPMHGTTIIEGGAITTDKLAAGAVTTDKLLAGAVTAAKIDSTSIGTELITAGTLRTAATGERLELNSQGVVLFGADAEDGERVRLGPAGDNLLTIGTSTISDTNVSAESGNYDTLTVGGEDILEMFPPLPRGRVAQNWLTKTTDYSDSRLQKRFYVEFETEPGRQYVATVPPFYLQVLKPAGISVSYRMHVWNLDTGAVMENDVQIHSTRNSIPDMNLHTVPGAVIDLPNFSVPTLFRFVVGTVSGSGEGVRVRAANNYKAGITIDDVGPIKDNAGSYWTYGNLGDGSGGNEPPPPSKPEPTKYTKTWSYAGYGGDLRSGEVIQGQYGSYGNRSGSWTFPTAMRTALSGAKIEKFEIYLYATHWYYNAGGTASIRPTNGNYQGWTGSAFTKSGWPRSAGKWVSVPSSWFPYIVSGTYKGIGVQTGSSSLQYYGRFKATSTKFRVTYRK